MILVTGGAGFLGSSLVRRLVEMGEDVVVIDNLSTGRYELIRDLVERGEVKFIKGDLRSLEDCRRALTGVSEVYHLAANPEVRLGEHNPRVDFENNLIATYNLLEAMREEKIKDIVFTSTSAVYGDASKIPTPEYHEMKPISIYGATKLGCEALISAYSHTFDFNALIFRLANIIGPGLTHGVIYDFVKKLSANPKVLEILGDGSQKKSYLYIDDCIDAMLVAKRKFRGGQDVFNIGNLDWINVKRIAEIVCECMGLRNVEFRFLGGYEGRGWRGDVKLMLLDIDKIMKIGWKPKYTSEDAVKITACSISKSYRNVSEKL